MKIKKKVLIVDDEKKFHSWMENRISSTDNIEFVYLEDGFQVASYLSDKIPSLIFLDVVIPGADGYAICRVIKNNPNTSHIPVILMSGKTGEELVYKYRSIGANDYLLKPFTVEEFVKKLELYLTLIDDNNVECPDTISFELKNDLLKFQLDDLSKTTNEILNNTNVKNKHLSIENIESLFADLDPSVLLDLKEFSGNNRNLRMRLKITDNKMTSNVVLHPFFGKNEKVTVDEIIEFLQISGIVYGFDRDAIEEGIEIVENTGEIHEFIAAKGCKPVDGNDTEIEFCFENSNENFKKNEDGSINYKEKNNFIEVKAGQCIGKIKKHFVGEDGINIYGNPVPAIVGRKKEIVFGDGLCVEEDKIYAAKNGYLLITGNRYDVQDCYIIETDVGIETGNISFNGNIVIMGNIKRGYSVKCGGELKIYGNVESSKVECSRNIIIKGGVVGSELVSRIISGGRIILKYAENAHLIASEEILIRDSSVNSSIYCGGKVNLLTGRGRIIGGKICATESISCIDAGSLSELKTELIVGEDHLTRVRIDSIEKHLKMLSSKMNIVHSIMKSMKQKGMTKEILHIMQNNPNAKDFMANYMTIKETYTSLSKQRLELQKELYKNKTGYIIVTGSTYRNVALNIYGTLKILKETTVNTKFCIDDNNKIIMGPAV